MAVEIERKFLVDIAKWNKWDKGARNLYRQGYILTHPDKTIRIRLTDQCGFITIKGKSVGAARPEFEYAIPGADAAELLDRFCSSTVSKFRYRIVFFGKVWEVDEFLGENEGLTVAEIELVSEDEAFALPDWIKEEVTGVEKYYNSNLSKRPFKQWD